MPPKVEYIPSNAAAEHHQSHLDIWTRDHLPGQIIGSPFTGIRTRSSKDLIEHYHYAIFMSSTEPKTIKDTLLDNDWIVTIQEELAAFERNNVWKLVPKPKGHTTVQNH